MKRCEINSIGEEIEIAISTYKRPHILECWLQENYLQLRQLGISLAIYDSSPDDETKKIVENFNKSFNISKIRYVRIDENLRLDEKVMKSIMDSSAAYVWPMGDSVSICFAEIESKVFPFIQQKYDFACIYSVSKVNNDGKTYDSALEFFYDCFWHVTWLGGLIFKKEIFQSLDNQKIYHSYLEKYNRNDGFSYLGIFFELIAEREVKCSFSIIACNSAFSQNKVPGWLKRYMEVWCDNLIYFVDTIPEYYNPAKEKVIKETWKVLELDGIWSYKARISGGLNREIYDYYDDKGYIDRVLDDKRRIKRIANLKKPYIYIYKYIFKIECKYKQTIKRICFWRKQ